MGLQLGSDLDLASFFPHHLFGDIGAVGTEPLVQPVQIVLDADPSAAPEAFGSIVEWLAAICTVILSLNQGMPVASRALVERAVLHCLLVPNIGAGSVEVVECLFDDIACFRLRAAGAASKLDAILRFIISIDLLNKF